MLTRALFLAFLCPAIGLAQVPYTISFQGTLADSTSGLPTNGSVSMDLSLHTLAVGGSQLWTETQPSVSVVDGVFNVLIGAVNPLDPADFASPPFLEISVDAEVIGDRVALVSVPFAFHAANADTATYVQNLCNQGDFLNCYTGSPATLGVGECTSGIRTCSPDGSGFAACTGEVTPIVEECSDGEDDDCDGVVDDGCCTPVGIEPNESEAQTVSLGSKDASSSTSQYLGTLPDTSDVDWYRFNGLDDASAEPRPSIGINSTGSLEVCAYFVCSTGSLQSFTCTGSSSATSPLGKPGCCRTGNGTISTTADLDCDGTSQDDVQIFMSVDDTGTAACTDYTLTYGI